MGCGIILLVGSVFLFVGMGINYRLLDKEAKEESKRAKVHGREDDANKDSVNREPGKEVSEALRAPDAAEDTV